MVSIIEHLHGQLDYWKSIRQLADDQSEIEYLDKQIHNIEVEISNVVFPEVRRPPEFPIPKLKRLNRKERRQMRSRGY